MAKLIIIQENLSYKDVLSIATSFTEAYGPEKTIVVFNTDTEKAENELSILTPDIDSYILMRDYYYERFGKSSSLYTAFENVEPGDTVLLCIPSECIKTGESFELNCDKLIEIAADQIDNYESVLAEALAKS